MKSTFSTYLSSHDKKKSSFETKLSSLETKSCTSLYDKQADLIYMWDIGTETNANWYAHDEQYCLIYTKN